MSPKQGLQKLHPSESLMDVRFGKSTFNHFNPYQSLLLIVNEQESLSSHFLPYLTVSDITNHAFLIFDSVYNQSLID